MTWEKFEGDGKERIKRNGKIYVKVSENQALEEYCKIYAEEKSIWDDNTDRELLIIKNEDNR